MDVAKASDQIDALIDKRAGERNAANELQAMYEAGVGRHREKLRRRHRAEWFAYFSRLADAHARISEHFEEKARALLEDELPKGASK